MSCGSLLLRHLDLSSALQYAGQSHHQRHVPYLVLRTSGMVHIEPHRWKTGLFGTIGNMVADPHLTVIQRRWTVRIYRDPDPGC